MTGALRTNVRTTTQARQHAQRLRLLQENLSSADVSHDSSSTVEAFLDDHGARLDALEALAAATVGGLGLGEQVGILNALKRLCMFGILRTAEGEHYHTADGEHYFLDDCFDLNLLTTASGIAYITGGMEAYYLTDA